MFSFVDLMIFFLTCVYYPVVTDSRGGIALPPSLKTLCICEKNFLFKKILIEKSKENLEC